MLTAEVNIYFEKCCACTTPQQDHNKVYDLLAIRLLELHPFFHSPSIFIGTKVIYYLLLNQGDKRVYVKC